MVQEPLACVLQHLQDTKTQSSITSELKVTSPQRSVMRLFYVNVSIIHSSSHLSYATRDSFNGLKRKEIEGSAARNTYISEYYCSV